MIRKPDLILPRPLSTKAPWLPAAVVILLAIPLLAHGIRRGDFYFNDDETLHAVGGLFFADVLHDWPITDPMHYGLRWYAHYPALGIGVWPPLVYLVEGIFFLVLGPSPVTARLAILSFALFGLYYWYRLVAKLLNQWAAVFATLLFALLPFVLIFERSVMLEVPALSLCIAATSSWLSYLESEEPKELYWFALFSALALLTKQLSIYLVLFCLLTLLTEKKLRLLRTRSMLVALGMILLLAGPFYVFAFRLAFTVAKLDVIPKGNEHLNALLFYPHALLVQLGLPLLVLSMVGIVTCRWWASTRLLRLIGAWIAACYLAFSFLRDKDPRFAIYWIPAFLLLIIGPLTSSAVPRRARIITVPVLALLIAHETWVAWHFQREYVSGYEPIARKIMENGRPGFVLFDGQLPGNFVFYVRTLDPKRECVVLRKVLYATLIGKSIGSVEFVHDRAELVRLLSLYGVRYIVVDNGPTEFDIQKTLRNYLQDSPYRLLATFPIESNAAYWKGRKFFVYESPAPLEVTAQSLDLTMLTMGRKIVIPINDLEIK